MTEKEKPLVSIAMCTYNGELFLRQQMDSLLAQDYPNHEIIITDDCSSDTTFQILKEYQAEHPHIRAIQNETNLGFVKNFEKSISLCSGDFVALCDQDDIWFPDKLSTLFNHIGDANLIYSDIQLVDADREEIDRSFPSCNRLEGRCHMGMLFANCVTGHACLIKREVLQEALPFPEEITLHDHWIAFVAAAMGGIKAHPAALSLYRHIAGNAVLRNKKKKRRKHSKARKLKRKYSERAAFLKCAEQSAGLTPEERQLIQEIRQAYSNYPRCLKNTPLCKILKMHPDILLPLYRNREKRLKKLSRGFWGELL
jgi:glycosyltransferase involved in cell wall biosynthesis